MSNQQTARAVGARVGRRIDRLSPWALVACVLAIAIFTLSVLPSFADAATPVGSDARRSDVAPAAALPGSAAGDGALAAVKSAVEGWLANGHKVDEVRRTPVPGVFEVRIGTEFIYVDGQGQYAFIQGDLIDMKGNRNLTRERTDQVMAIDFRQLPLELAIKQVRGNGKRVLAVFEDPNCGYCRNLRADLNQMDNTTVYTFALPILAADSESKARKALCAEDRAKAWSDMMTTGRVPGNPGTCKTTHMEDLMALGSKLNVSVTPTIFFTSGQRVRGYVPPVELEKLLDRSTLPPG